MISLDQFVANEAGKKHLIPGQSEIYRGQCVQLIGVYLKAIYGQDLPAHPNAKDYWASGIPGWSRISSAPQNGDIAVYNGHGAFPEGHIGIYYNGQIFEENADPDGSPAHLFNRANTYLLGYLHKQGEDMATIQQLQQDLANATAAAEARAAFLAQIAQAAGDNPDHPLTQDDVNKIIGHIDSLNKQIAAKGTVLKPGNYIVPQ